jgi:hypothetical protein
VRWEVSKMSLPARPGVVWYLQRCCDTPGQQGPRPGGLLTSKRIRSVEETYGLVWITGRGEVLKTSVARERREIKVQNSRRHPPKSRLSNYYRSLFRVALCIPTQFIISRSFFWWAGCQLALAGRWKNLRSTTATTFAFIQRS